MNSHSACLATFFTQQTENSQFIFFKNNLSAPLSDLVWVCAVSPCPEGLVRAVVNPPRPDLLSSCALVVLKATKSPSIFDPCYWGLQCREKLRSLARGDPASELKSLSKQTFWLRAFVLTEQSTPKFIVAHFRDAVCVVSSFSGCDGTWCNLPATTATAVYQNDVKHD